MYDILTKHYKGEPRFCRAPILRGLILLTNAWGFLLLPEMKEDSNKMKFWFLRGAMQEAYDLNIRAPNLWSSRFWALDKMFSDPPNWLVFEACMRIFVVHLKVMTPYSTKEDKGRKTNSIV